MRTALGSRPARQRTRKHTQETRLLSRALPCGIWVHLAVLKLALPLGPLHRVTVCVNRLGGATQNTQKMQHTTAHSLSGFLLNSARSVGLRCTQSGKHVPWADLCPEARGGLTCPSAAFSQRHFLGTTPNHSPAAPDTPTVSIDCARPEPITFGTATLTRLAVRSVAEQLLEHALPHLPFTRRVHLVRREGRDVSS